MACCNSLSELVQNEVCLYLNKQEERRYSAPGRDDMGDGWQELTHDEAVKFLRSAQEKIVAQEAAIILNISKENKRKKDHGKV